MHNAAWNGLTDIAKVLVAAGADVNAGKEQGSTPLYEAAQPLGDQNRIDVVNLLLANDAQIIPGDTRVNEGLLHFAVEHGLRDLVERLLTGGANANAVDSCRSGLSVLEQAVVCGDKEVVRLLIAHGADVNRRGQGGTPLCYARKWNKEAIEVLLANGADVNAAGVLQSAVAAGEKEIVELFLAHGADVNVKNYQGETPLDEAIARGYQEIVALLREHAKEP